jgi:hypothetical protein
MMGIVATPCVAVPIIIPKIVMMMERMDKQMEIEKRKIDEAVRPVIITGIRVDRVVIVDRRIEVSPQWQPIVPIATDINTAKRRPNVLTRHPDEIVAVGIPIAGSPAVATIPIEPSAGNPEMIVRWRVAGRAFFDARRRRVHILDVARVLLGPET